MLVIPKLHTVSSLTSILGITIFMVVLQGQLVKPMQKDNLC